MPGRRSLALRLRLPAVLLGFVLLAGCGGARFDAAPLITQFDLEARDVLAANPDDVARRVLGEGQRRRDLAAPLVAAGKGAKAAPTLVTATAASRAALALVDRAKAETEAGECLRLAESARRSWEQTLIMLEQTERVAARSAADVPRESPWDAEADPGSAAGDPDPALRDADTAAWEAALARARALGLSTGGIEARRGTALGRLADTGTPAEERPEAQATLDLLYTELGARIGEARRRGECAEARTRIAWYSDAREAALRGTLELERDLKASLRDELEQARAEAESRQTDLYQSLQQLEGKFASITREARGTIVSLADILFDFGKATLKRDVEFNLVKIATILNQFPEMKIMVEGHTDNVGSEAFNLDLSEKRAQAVRDFLVSQGVAAERLSVAGYGFGRPRSTNDTEAGRQQNRRVDLVIQDRP